MVNRIIDNLSEYLAARKGLLPILGIILIIINYIFQFFPMGWIGSSNLLLHVGLVIAIFGLMLAWIL
jgi:hypothetical protein